MWSKAPTWIVILIWSATARCVAPEPGPPATRALEQPCGDPGGDLYEEDHFVSTTSGAVLHVRERTSDRAQARRHPRSILLLSGTFVTGVQYDARVPGDDSYNALDLLASVGFNAYAVTYEGYGLSSLPADGRDVTAERSLHQMGEVVTWIRQRTGARRVDVLGCSLGSSLAVALGGTESPVPRSHVGRIVLTSHVYRGVTPLMEQLLFSPETLAALENAPGGYIMTIPDMYGILLASATPEAAGWGFATFPGVYAVGPTLEGFELPIFDGQNGRALALQFWGDADLVTPWTDVQQFEAEYGGDLGVVVLGGGGHAPAFEPVRGEFWWRTLLFLLLPRPFALLVATGP